MEADPDMAFDIESLRQWIGRTQTLHDTVTTMPLRALSATLDRDDILPGVGDPVPPGGHWLYFLPVHRQSGIGPDGHPQRGGFLPPVSLPRRMWAGSQIVFERPLTVGQAIVRRSRIEAVEMKEGRSGPLVFVKLLHEVWADARRALTEQQDIVYRDLPKLGGSSLSGMPAPGAAAWTRRIEPDGVLLFRYSALTFNGHRIHYDRRYAVEVEGYPGLVVHGPLIATLLLDLLRRERPQARLERFEFKAVRPLFDDAPFEVCARDDDGGVRLWAQTLDGQVAMQAHATLD